MSESGKCTASEAAAILLNIPTEGEVRGLTIELYILIMVYVFTVVFTCYNIYAYLWK